MARRRHWPRAGVVALVNLAGRARQDLAQRMVNMAFAMTNGRGGPAYLQYRPDFQVRWHDMPEYRELYEAWTKVDKGLPHKGDLTRLYFLWLTIRRIRETGVEGAFAEVGVYKGVTARLIASLAPERRLYLFDTFEGFAQSDIKSEIRETGLHVKSSQFADTSIDRVGAFVGGDNVTLLPGRFPETAAAVPKETGFAFVHFDADLYEPARAACEYFYPRLSAGGVMVFHDFNSGFTGVRKAVEEFFADRPEGIVEIPDKSGSCVITRNRGA